MLLADSVRRQLVADVPCSVLLSGGLDSSAIAALAAKGTAETGHDVQTFALDLASGADGFLPDPLRATRDGPFARELARHIGSHHADVPVTAASVADAHVRARTVAARDLPGIGDMDQSLFLLFEAVRKQATVTLSGESADELFGGYTQFHNFAAAEAPTFPWMADRWGTIHGEVLSGLVNKGLMESLRLREYTADSYAAALQTVPVLEGEAAIDRRMREVTHLHLTHFLPQLLDRKDRLSMAVGLEVRLPFCDHRLVEYVFNAPWTLKTFDGREKSLLRSAVADLLPKGILSRKKSAFPCFNDGAYLSRLQEQVAGIVCQKDHAVFDIFDRVTIAEAAVSPQNRLRTRQRLIFERVLETHTWIELRRPVFCWS
jgi:asparagine synthase (glutamine-hydrolysing)